MGAPEHWRIGDSRSGEALTAQLRSPELTRNPFLFDFYSLQRPEDSDDPFPVEHAGVLYASVVASAGIGEHAALILKDGDVADQPFLGVALVKEGLGPQARFQKIIAGPPTGELLTLPDTISEVFVDSGQVAVEIGNGVQTVLESPVFIETPLLSIEGTELYVRQPDAFRVQW